jgi:hypothetical protein
MTDCDGLKTGKLLQRPRSAAEDSPAYALRMMPIGATDLLFSLFEQVPGGRSHLLVMARTCIDSIKHGHDVEPVNKRVSTHINIEGLSTLDSTVTHPQNQFLFSVAYQFEQQTNKNISIIISMPVSTFPTF